MAYHLADDAKSCGRKFRYESMPDARRAMRALKGGVRAGHHGRPVKDVAPYRCRACHGFHLGRPLAGAR